MRLVVKDMDIATGDVVVVIIHENDAKEFDLHHMDRVIVKKGRREAMAVVNVGESKKAVRPGHIGFFEEALDAVGAVHGDKVTLKYADKPEGFAFIRKKLDGKELSENEMHTVIMDVGKNRLTNIEITSFIVALYLKGLSDREVLYMTRALAKSGEMVGFKTKPIVDFHCIGGVPGNRTTLVVAPILVAAGLKVPKCSSRAITSPAGTADTMEVLAPVALSASELKRLVNDVGGVIAWGGGVNLAPADDRMIQIEHPLNINAEGQMLASIMAKKFNVGDTHLLLDLPVGRQAKLADRDQAKHLCRKFVKLGKELGIKVKTIITDGSEPVGNGIGPVLEARDCLYILKNDERGPKDLLKSSIHMAGAILEFVGKADKGKGKSVARRLVKSGAAYGAFVRMIEAQGGKEVQPDDLRLAKHTKAVRAKKSGTVSVIENKAINRIARLAGAPVDKESGIFLHKHCGDSVKKGEVLFTIHAPSKRKLDYAIDAYEKLGGFAIK